MLLRSFSRAINKPTTPASRRPLARSAARRPVDGSGYILRRSVFDPSTKPEYTLPVIVHGGVTEMMKAVFRWRGEGFASLWKGQLTTFMIDALSSTLQPIILTTLSFALNPSSPMTLSLPLEHHAHPTLPLLLSVSSFVITGIILSPLDLIRTRLIVQSSQSRHRKYRGPFSGISLMLQEEGGWTSLYFHPHLIIPTLLDNVARPLLHLASPLLLDRCLRLDRSSQPIWWGLSDLVFSTAGLLVILPLETIRKRLQLQSRLSIERSRDTTTTTTSSSSLKTFKACVEIRPVPYHGVVDALYRIVTEESGRPTNPTRPKTIRLKSTRRHNNARTVDGEEDHDDVDGKMSSSEIVEVAGGNSKASGLLQLYRGFNVGLTANLLVFFLSLVGKPGELAAGAAGGGWTEL